MLDAFKRWFGRPAAAAPADTAAGGAALLQAWADRHGHGWRGVRDDADGLVVDGRLGALGWRMEWGAPQRSYIAGRELRLRAELGLPGDLQAVVMDRPLAQRMEAAVFEQFVEGVQTRIDAETPPEMRWLVMHPKLASGEMGPARDRFVALGTMKAFVGAWLAGEFGNALGAMPTGDDAPLVLALSRGRLTLRMAMPGPDEQALDRALRLFETAMREARRVGNTVFGSEDPSTQPSLWSASALPPGEGPGNGPR